MSQFNGLLLINKPIDMTSHDVVGALRKKLGQREIGHTGTLDPIATGLMVIVLGEATKLSDYLLMDNKSYRLRAKLGVTTDTLDRTGQVLSSQEVAVPSDRIRAAALELVGNFNWPVPIFSAVKVQGEKLYEKGRRGESFETPVKPMCFWNAEIHEIGSDTLDVSVHCSKGSFIRTWISQLGEKLGTGAMMEALIRQSVGPWSLSAATELDEVSPSLTRGFIPLSEALPFMKAFFVEGRDQRLLLNGQVPKDLAARLVFEQKEAFRLNSTVTVKVVDAHENMLALVAAIPGQGVKIRRIFKA